MKMRTTTIKPPTIKRKNAAYNRFAKIDTENKMERKWRDGGLYINNNTRRTDGETTSETR
jgi:hypothetical protein